MSKFGMRDGCAMAITIMNDASAAMTLGELNKNISQLGKQLKKVSSGQRINSAGDDASGYSVSEKMRVRIRALDQDERNVQNGAALLRTAEGAIQQQIEIMKTIKEKVIDADNDTNTDLDRATIQKEIDQGYRQIEDIARETNYNGKYLLTGDTVSEKVFSWEILDKPVPTGGDLGIIKTTYSGSLDGVEGPFGLFSEPWPSSSSNGMKNSSASGIHLSYSNPFKGGKQDMVSHVFSLDLSSYGSVGALNKKGFRIGSTYFVLTDDKSKEYQNVNNSNEIDISRCTSVEQVANAIKNRVNEVLSGTLTATVDGAKVTFTGKTAGSTIYYAGTSGIEGQATTTTMENQTDNHFGTVRFTGGKNEKKPDPNDPDSPHWDAQAASCTVSLGTVSAGQCITVRGGYYSTAVVEFVNGSGFSGSGSSYKIGTDWTGTGTVAGMTFERKDNGDLVVTAPLSLGETPNTNSYYYVQDGKATSTPTGPEYTKYTAISGFANVRPAAVTETSHAKLTIDLSNYKNKHAEDLDGFIEALNGKVISHSRYSSYYGANSSYTYFEAECVDSASNLSEQYRNKYAQGFNIDLNKLRSTVNNETSIAEAFASLMKNELGAKGVTVSINGDGNLEIAARQSGTTGNNECLYVHEASWRSLDIDLNDLFAKGLSIPEDLDMQGFRAYCATDASQWFNFEFVNGMENLDDKPASGTDEFDIKSIMIDVSEVTDAVSLAKAIYEQGNPELTWGSPNPGSSDYNSLNHHMRIAADTKNGIVTLYDQRQYFVGKSAGYDYQEKGAKTKDGILDNVIRSTRKIYVKDLVIQHTDHASQNIHVRVPQTSMDHLFGYIPGDRDLSEFNVLSAASREELLGNKAGKARNGRIVPKDEPGLLDTALDYLTSANTLIGAQIMRLGMAENNIVTSRESTVFSESTIRDADMAKEMTDYTKANVLAQSAQSMLAQANQNSSAILSLLQ